MTQKYLRVFIFLRKGRPSECQKIDLVDVRYALTLGTND